MHYEILNYFLLILDCEVFAYQNRFDDLIRIADNYPANVEVIINDVKSLIAKSEIERRALMKTVSYTLYPNHENAGSTEIHESKDSSMMRLLLLNGHLQNNGDRRYIVSRLVAALHVLDQLILNF